VELKIKIEININEYTTGTNNNFMHYNNDNLFTYFALLYISN